MANQDLQRAERELQRDVIALLKEHISWVSAKYSEISLDEKNYHQNTRDLAIDLASDFQKKLKDVERVKESPREYIHQLEDLLSHYGYRTLSALVQEGEDYRRESAPQKQKKVPKQIYLNSRGRK